MLTHVRPFETAASSSKRRAYLEVALAGQLQGTRARSWSGRVALEVHSCSNGSCYSSSTSTVIVKARANVQLPKRPIASVQQNVGCSLLSISIFR